jgi:hypothetical protein
MNTCDTCKWWGTGNTGTFRGEQSCGKLETVPKKYASNNGFAVDKEGNQGFLCGPKFGCVHWEQK